MAVSLAPDGEQAAIRSKARHFRRKPESSALISVLAPRQQKKKCKNKVTGFRLSPE
jgi:hypothetical protein